MPSRRPVATCRCPTSPAPPASEWGPCTGTSLRRQAGIETAREALTHEDPWEAIEWLVHQSAAKMALSRGLRDAMSVIDFGDDNPWNTDDARRCAAAVLDRARDAAAIRTDLTVDDWQALMCGLSAAIATGADPARQAEFVLAGIRSR